MKSFKDYVQEGLNGFPVKVFTPRDMESPSYNLMAYAHFTLLASGTAELEASMLGAPHVGFYRVNPITYLWGRLLVKVNYVALTNLILQREVVPEFLQRSPEELCIKVKSLLEDEKLREAMREDFKRLREDFNLCACVCICLCYWI